MSYRRVPNIYTLTDIKTEEGLIVRVTGLKIGRLRKLAALLESDEDGFVENLDEVISLLLGGIVSWNLEDDNGPVDITREAIEDFEVPALFSILEKWMDETTGVSAELGKESPSGATFPGRPLTMEAL